MWWEMGGGHLVLNLGHPRPRVTAVIFPTPNLPASAQHCRRTTASATAAICISPGNSKQPLGNTQASYHVTADIAF